MEGQLLSSLEHPNIVQLKKVIESQRHILMVMEYLGGGTLKNFIENRKQMGSGHEINEEDAASMMKGIVSGLDYLHSKGIIHRDLKPENILFLKTNDVSSIKLIDFGLSIHNDALTEMYQSEDDNGRGGVGTMLYMAPEIINYVQYSKEVDIFSAGIVMYNLLTTGGHPLYKANSLTKQEYIKHLKEFNHTVMMKKVNELRKLSSSARHLLSKILEPNVSDRYTTQQILQHPWITRKENTIAPQTIGDMLRTFSTKQSLVNVMKALFFCSYSKKWSSPRMRNNEEDDDDGLSSNISPRFDESPDHRASHPAGHYMPQMNLPPKPNNNNNNSNNNINGSKPQFKAGTFQDKTFSLKRQDLTKWIETYKKKNESFAMRSESPKLGRSSPNDRSQLTNGNNNNNNNNITTGDRTSYLLQNGQNNHSTMSPPNHNTSSISPHNSNNRDNPIITVNNNIQLRNSPKRPTYLPVKSMPLDKEKVDKDVPSPSGIGNNPQKSNKNLPILPETDNSRYNTSSQSKLSQKDRKRNSQVFFGESYQRQSQTIKLQPINTVNLVSINGGGPPSYDESPQTDSPDKSPNLRPRNKKSSKEASNNEEDNEDLSSPRSNYYQSTKTLNKYHRAESLNVKPRSHVRNFSGDFQMTNYGNMNPNKQSPPQNHNTTMSSGMHNAHHGKSASINHTQSTGFLPSIVNVQQQRNFRIHSVVMKK